MNTLNVSKKCGTCGNYLRIELFSKDRNRPDGKSGRCKSCAKEHYKCLKNRNKPVTIDSIAKLNLYRKEMLIKMTIDNFNINSSTRLP